MVKAPVKIPKALVLFWAAAKNFPSCRRRPWLESPFFHRLLIDGAEEDNNIQAVSSTEDLAARVCVKENH